MFKSIRWSLLFWYAIILIGVIGGFATTLYYKLERSMLRVASGSLETHARGLAGSLKVVSPGRYELELSDGYVEYFQQKGEDAPYYVIWGLGMQGWPIVDRSDPALEIENPERANAFEDRLDFIKIGPGGAVILVGRGIHWERHQLQEFVQRAAAIGTVVFVVAMAGGWLLAGRALRPVERITRAAANISATNLSERIDVAHTESELGRLAKTLNETFGRLEEAFERQTRFTADASHEMRTPLSIMMSQAELALKKERPAAEYREALETSLRAARRMKDLVEGLLTLARADARELDLRRENLDFRKVVEEAAALLAPAAAEKKVALVVDAGPVEVTGDPDRLREVAVNLLTNAIRYNREGGRVEARLRAEDGIAVLAVTDTGIGIPEKDRPHVFERFYRADKARTREAGGVGLGLAITKSIVEAHGGTISFESREGEGTTFIVRLPRL